MNRQSILFKVLRRIDNLWFHLEGYIPDYERLDWVCEQRQLFTKAGLIKQDISIIPFRDARLKSIAAQYGGWCMITSPDFTPPEDLKNKLAAIGLGPDEFALTRKYCANPSLYTSTHLHPKSGN